MSNNQVRKNSITMLVSEEQAAMRYGFNQRGHYEPVTPAPEQIAQHARAVEIIKEFETNPYLWAGYDGEVDVQPLGTQRWVPDETHEEWMARWREYVRTQREQG